MNTRTFKLIKASLCAAAIVILLTALLPVSVMADVATVALTGPETPMDPQVAQNVTVHVHMSGETLASLTGITFKVYHASGMNADNAAAFGLESPNPQTCAVITWAPPNSFVMTPMGFTTWSLSACTTPALSSDTGDFVFGFIPGKVAVATFGSDSWQMGASVTTGATTFYSFAPSPSDMNVYQQVSISASTLSWGAVAAGTTSEAPLGTITIISNTAYGLDVQSTDWTGINGHMPVLDPSGQTTTAQHFELWIDGGEYGDFPISSSCFIFGSDQGPPATTEAGVPYSGFIVYLQLAGTFAPDSYGGIISFSLVDITSRQ